jgi:Ca2+-binding RTX toxin-like protein
VAVVTTRWTAVAAWTPWSDTLVGGAGNDTYIINNTGVTITEDSGPDTGTDTVISSINYTLGNNLENLTLTGSATKGTGNNLDNIITANGTNNHLIGGGGNDTLVINAAGLEVLEAGSKVIKASGLNAGAYDGGSGTDTFKITASAGATIDLRGIDNTKFISIETLDLTAQNNNILKLDLNTIKSLVDITPGTPTLSVKLASGDKIEFEAASGQQVFDNTATKNMTIFGGSGTSLEQLAIINYA